MYGVFVDTNGEISADSAGSSFFRVCSAHQFTVFQYCVFAFQYLDNDRAGNHESDQIFEKATFFMLCIKTFSLFLAQLQHF